MFTCVLGRRLLLQSYISTQTFRRALTAASVDSCAEVKSAPQWLTKSGRVWRKVPESDVRSVVQELCVKVEVAVLGFPS